MNCLLNLVDAYGIKFQWNCLIWFQILEGVEFLKPNSMTKSLDQFNLQRLKFELTLKPKRFIDQNPNIVHKARSLNWTPKIEKSEHMKWVWANIWWRILDLLRIGHMCLQKDIENRAWYHSTFLCMKLVTSYLPWYLQFVTQSLVFIILKLVPPYA